MSRVLTRKKLYDLAWTRPVTRVAIDFLVSD